MEPVSVLHLVPSFDLGQRAGVFLDLLRRIDGRRFALRILSLSPPLEGTRRDFEAAGVRVTHRSFVFEGGRGLAGRIAQRTRTVAALRDFLRVLQPRIVHTHEPQVNVYGGLAARWARVPHLMSPDWDPSPDGALTAFPERWADP